MTMSALISKYPIISDQVDEYELLVILRELQEVLGKDIEGEVLEFGCYVGTTSLFFQRILIGSGRQLHVYDSFAGLPEKQAEDSSPIGDQFKTGVLKSSKKALITNFKSANLSLPVIHKSWFDQLSTQDIPGSVAFAFLDGDYYNSILTCLKLVWPKLSARAIIVVDDYQSSQLPGVSKAVDLWLKTHPATIKVEASLAIITKL